MKVRVQEKSILQGPKTLSDVKSVVVYDDNTQPIMCVIEDGAGYRVTHKGMKSFEEDLKTVFKMELAPSADFEEIDISKP